jgi:hypothetical protein
MGRPVSGSGAVEGIRRLHKDDWKKDDRERERESERKRERERERERDSKWKNRHPPGSPRSMWQQQKVIPKRKEKLLSLSFQHPHDTSTCRRRI